MNDGSGDFYLKNRRNLVHSCSYDSSASRRTLTLKDELDEDELSTSTIHNNNDLSELLLGDGGRMNLTRSKREKEIQTTESSASLSIENVCWFVASILCIYFSDIINILIHDQKIYRSLMFISFSLIGINILIAMYLIIWLSHIKKIDSSKWSDLHPTLIPIATACFVSGSILLTIAIWPVYTWITAPLLFTIFMGIIVVIINLPPWI